MYNLRDESFNGMEYITSIVAQLEMIHAVTQEHDYPNVIYTEMLVDKTEVKFRVIGDNGPQFTADEFAEFSEKWDFEHLTSSPGNSKANGKAESGVKTAMRILKKSIRAGTDPYLAVFDYRNTPTQGMTTSPAQRLMSRRTKTLLSTTQSLLLPRTIDLEVEKKELRQRQQAQARYCSRSAKDLPSLSEGDVVRMKPFKVGDKSWRKGQVTVRLDKRSYTVETDDGAVYRRNRQHLNYQLNPSSQRQNQIWPVQMKRQLPLQCLPLTKVMPLMSHTLKW